MRKLWTFIFALAGLLLLGLAPGHAQATRTWVSGVGDDANPCSRTAPCKTFAGAISKTAAKGEISVLDPAGFGALTITKSISIVSEGSEGSILACGTNGINIVAAATDVVNLHGIFIEGCGNGLNGIKITSAAEVHIRKCLIRGFNTSAGTGILIAPNAGAVHAKVFVSDCTIAGNRRGIANVPSAGSADVFLDRVVVEDHPTSGIIVKGANAHTFMTNSVVTNNGRGLNASRSGTIVSFGNNAIRNNTTDGAPTSTVPLR